MTTVWRATRASSFATAGRALSGMCSSTSVDQTRSKWRSGNGIASRLLLTSLPSRFSSGHGDESTATPVPTARLQTPPLSAARAAAANPPSPRAQARIEYMQRIRSFPAAPERGAQQHIGHQPRL
eukprot:CAMPEP_0180301544 /NCGR_PEP_ID=MMETSP0988-20121125/23567_1 /TAXON_ID=697907 /ORGANISM="non described non described, Strain CCMP2293" /LENGTH=124 /DNA_ID=CAMNT_0022282153 /DNA_START=443 /DNA_END=815 /DNA_ORIENTATION=-